MSDFNFFSNFEKIRIAQKRKARTTTGIVVGVIVVLVLFYGIMGLRMLYLYHGIQSGNDFLNSPEVKTKIVELSAKKDATLNLKKYDADVMKATNKIVLTDKVSSEFMDAIEKAFPTTASLEYLDLKNNQVSLQGNAPMLTTTAELTHNLEATDLFTRVQVNSINKNKDAATYFFSLTCDLKEAAE